MNGAVIAAVPIETPDFAPAVEQSVPAFRANLVYTAVTVAANLLMMWLGRTRPRGSVGLLG